MKPLTLNLDAKNESADLYLYGVVGGDFFEDGFTPQDVRSALGDAKDAKTLNIYIDSPGGSAYAGLNIRSQLEASRKRINVEVHGLAASAASIIAMAGDSILMHAGSEFMVHDVHAGLYGTASELRKAADVAEQMSGDLANIYAKRTGNDAKTISKMMADETWMTAQEALELGFATKVVEPKAKMAAWSCDHPGAVLALMNRMELRNVPERLLSRMASIAPEDAQAKTQTDLLRARIAEFRAQLPKEETPTQKLRRQIAAMKGVTRVA